MAVSVTLRCNQACAHCHVSSSPSRSEMMDAETMTRVVEVASAVRPSVVDVTGGAPELNPHLPDFLRALRADGHRVQLRTNLTVLADPEYAALADFYAASGIELLASMPCYTERNVDVIRGAGVRDASVRMLLRAQHARLRHRRRPEARPDLQPGRARRFRSRRHHWRPCSARSWRSGSASSSRICSR